MISTDTTPATPLTEQPEVDDRHGSRLVTNRQTLPVIVGIDSDAERFDILDPFHRVFWRDMDRETTLIAMRKLGAQHLVVPTTGRDYGDRVPREEWGF